MWVICGQDVSYRKKTWEHFKGQIFHPIFMKLYQNNCHDGLKAYIYVYIYMGQVRSKRRSQGQIIENLLDTLEATFFVQSLWIFARIFACVTLSLLECIVHVRSETRTRGQIKEKPCKHSISHTESSKIKYLLYWLTWTILSPFVVYFIQ